jgi:hypothetical protein
MLHSRKHQFAKQVVGISRLLCPGRHQVAKQHLKRRTPGGMWWWVGQYLVQIEAYTLPFCRDTGWLQRYRKRWGSENTMHPLNKLLIDLVKHNSPLFLYIT